MNKYELTKVIKLLMAENDRLQNKLEKSERRRKEQYSEHHAAISQVSYARTGECKDCKAHKQRIHQLEEQEGLHIAHRRGYLDKMQGLEHRLRFDNKAWRETYERLNQKFWFVAIAGSKLAVGKQWEHFFNVTHKELQNGTTHTDGTAESYQHITERTRLCKEATAYLRKRFCDTG